MILSSPTSDQLTGTEARVVVVGSGPVGLAVAATLARRGVRVLVLESGVDARDDAAQQLSAAENASPAHHYPPHTTVARRLGGTGNIWGGRVVPFDPEDLAVRPWLDLPLWPIGWDDLVPWIAPAADWLGGGEPVYDEALDGVRGDAGFRYTTLERWAAEPRTHELHRQELTDSRELVVALGCTATGFDYAPSGRITAVRVHTRSAGEVSVPADEVVVAGGGNETTRLLLNEQAARPALFGGPDGPLGRYYQAHVNGQIADIVFEDPALHAGLDFHEDGHGSFVRRRITPAPDTQKAAHLPNVAFWPVVPPVSDPAHRSGPLSLVYLGLTVEPIARRFLAEAIRIKHVGAKPYRRGPHVVNVLRDLPRAVALAPRVLRQRRSSSSRVPGFFLTNPARRYGLEYHAEHLPNPDSRLTLADDRDETGLRRLRVDIRFSDDDAAGVLRAHDALEEWLTRNRLARLEYRAPLEQRAHAVIDEAFHGTHQVGTARMGADRATAVVDRDCRTFDVPNLSLASTAVLPTSGQGNPTMTAVMLALRLGDRLAGELAGEVGGR